MAGTTLATPQLGGTQDVALRAWLGKQGLKQPQRRGRRRHQPDLVDKKDLWDRGQFPTNILIVSKKFAADHAT